MAYGWNVEGWIRRAAAVAAAAAAMTGAALGQSVSLAWDANAEADLAGYHVYRSTTPGAGYVRLTGSPVTTASYTDGSVTYGKTYYYVCTAVGTTGLESGYSNEAATALAAPNRMPTAGDDAVRTAEDEAAVVAVLGNDGDADGDALRVTGVTQGTHGTVTTNGTTVVYVPEGDFWGTDRFGYTVEDGRGGTATAAVTVTVEGVNDAPWTVQDEGTTATAGETVELAVLGNDGDVDGDALTVAWATAETGGTATAAGTGVRFEAAGDFSGTAVIRYGATDGRATTEGRATVEVAKAAAAGRLHFPATIDDGSANLANTYVGVGLVNAGDSTEAVTLAAHDAWGRETGTGPTSKVLNPRGQAAFLTGDAVALTADAATVEAAAAGGSVQGFFMVGDYRGQRLDGVGARAEAGRSLVFGEISESTSETTLLQIVNGGGAEARVSLRLHLSDGTVQKTAEAAVAAGGSFKGTVGEIFGVRTADGYVTAESTEAVTGYAVTAGRRSLRASAGRTAQTTGRLTAPHFFADAAGGTTTLRVVNLEGRALTAEVRVLDEAGVRLGSTKVSLPAGGLRVIDAGAMLAGINLKKAGAVSGSVELTLTGGETGRILASLTYQTAQGRAATSAPMLAEGRTRTIIPQVAQAADGSVFTGLAVSNPGWSAAAVTVEAYDETGRTTASRTVTIPAGGRLVDLLNGAGLFGPGFSQMNGHLRLTADSEVSACAIFGDAAGEYLSLIEGQAPVQPQLQ